MRRVAASVAASAVCATAWADEPPARPLWEAGVFVIGASQPAYPGSKQRVDRALPLPFLIYRGEYLRAEQGSVGVRAAKTDDVELDIGFSGSFGSASNDNDARRGMPSIGTLGEFGPRLKWNLGDAPWNGRWRLELPLRGVWDVSHGFGFRGVSFEPELAWTTRSDEGWSYGTAASLLFGNARLADTFYGVAPQFVTATRPAYEARAGLIATRLSVNLYRKLTPDWRVFGYARYDSVAGAANRNSPLVETNGGAALGVGLAWTWGRSTRSAKE